MESGITMETEGITMKKRMKPSVKKILNLIDEHLAKGNNASKDLWYVLSALRGPDTGHGSAKLNTTVFIRSAALPKTDASKRKANLPISFASEYSNRKYDSSVVGIQVSLHFKSHADKAARVLGLIDADA